MAGKTYLIDYQTGNSARIIGVINFAAGRAEALMEFAEANGLKIKLHELEPDPAKPYATLKGRTGTLYAIEYNLGPLFFCQRKIEKRRDFDIPVLFVGRERGMAGLNGTTKKIMPLPASSDLLPKPIVDGSLYEPEAPQTLAEGEPVKEWRRCYDCEWPLDDDEIICPHCGAENDPNAPPIDGPFETIIDEHDGQTDLRAVITLPNGFKVEVAIEDSTGTPQVSLYTGIPSDPGSPIPENLTGQWFVSDLIG